MFYKIFGQKKKKWEAFRSAYASVQMDPFTI